MHKIGDILLYKLDSKLIKEGEEMKKNDRFYIENITNGIYSVHYHVYKIG